MRKQGPYSIQLSTESENSPTLWSADFPRPCQVARRIYFALVILYPIFIFAVAIWGDGVGISTIIFLAVIFATPFILVSSFYAYIIIQRRLAFAGKEPVSDESFALQIACPIEIAIVVRNALARIYDVDPMLIDAKDGYGWFSKLHPFNAPSVDDLLSAMSDQGVEVVRAGGNEDVESRLHQASTVQGLVGVIAAQELSKCL